MSLTTPGVWAIGIWNPSVWADGVWFEGAKQSVEEPQPRGQAIWLQPFEEIGRNRFLKRRVRKIIEEVAIQQADNLHLDEQQRFDQLQAELKAENIEFQANYLEALNTYREMLIANEIKSILIQKDESEAMLLILIAAHLT